MRFARVASLGLCALLVTSCSGGGGGAGSPGAPPAANDQGFARVTVPVPAASAAGRHRNFISPSVSSAALDVSGESPVIADLSATSPTCATSDAGRTCTIAILARPGNDALSVTLYAGPGATGTVLGTGSSTIDVTGNGFSVPLTVNGEAATIVLAASGTFVEGTPGNVTIAVSAEDGGGNAIVGTYAIPIALTSSNAAHFTLSPASVTASGQSVTLHYDGAAGQTSDTVAANSGSVATTAVTDATVPVVPSGPTPTPSPTPAPTPTSTPTPKPTPTLTPTPTPTPTPATAGYGVFTPTYAGAKHLYVDDDTGGIYQYALPLTSGSVGVQVQPTEFDVWINFDPAGNMYLSQYNYGFTAPNGGAGSAAADTVYDLAAPFTGLPLETYQLSNTPAGVAVNSSGQVFIAQQDGGGGVLELSSLASKRPIQTIPVTDAYALAFDSAQNLYISNSSGISIYAPPYTTLKQQITFLSSVGAIAVTSKGYIFAGSLGNSIVIIAPPYAQSNVVATITSGINGPLGITGDAQGNLYVPNYDGGTIEAFAYPYTGAPYATISGSLPDAAAMGP